MSHITFNVAAKCDKAGRSQNQDNYWVCPNLEKIGDNSNVGNDHDIELSPKGALLVVADGMGGMKSGEKASEFVIEGIKKKFANIPDEILGDDNAIISFIKNAIIESDGIIKAYAKDHRESEGMGSTIVLVWLLGEKAYCGWCGDSRIYCYNPQNSLVRLSHDHSYVQSLVDEGKISEEDAFDHPDGNIITRSLGDSGEKANPETKIYPIHRRDVFLLCSDGLCGLLTDDKIESLLSDNCTSSEETLKALWQAGEKEGWSDNATIEVACITDGGVTPTRKAFGYSEKKPKPISGGKSDSVKKDTNLMPNFWANNKQYFIIVGVVALIAIGLIWYFSKNKIADNPSNQEFNIEETNIDGGEDSNHQNGGQGGNNQGGNHQNGGQGGNNQGGNHQNGGQGGNHQGGNHQNSGEGGNHQNGGQGGNHQGGNHQNGEQGGNHQDGNHQGGNQGGNQQGGGSSNMYLDEPSEEYIRNLINPTRQDYQNAKAIMNRARKNRGLSDIDMQKLGSFAYSVKDNLTQITSKDDYKRLPEATKVEIKNWKKLEIEVKNFQNEFRPQNIQWPNHQGNNPGHGVEHDNNTEGSTNFHEI